MKVILFFLIAYSITERALCTSDGSYALLHCTTGCICSYDPNNGHATCDSCLPGYIMSNENSIFPCTSKWLNIS